MNEKRAADYCNIDESIIHPPAPGDGARTTGSSAGSVQC